ncbi:glycosyl transferase family 2 [Bifidobacterium sp. UTCIF-39]|uniref:glycosyltransferase n=1 Tax=Bifidobacterium sp. UTCIF-39 TaxID=1465359 RepID=UPI00112C6465|nr:glycosyltransferase [Bifidobacterium sp. UTCIF-39]TPF97430.1 glycosyl transferase family 2 [Bifidobacterium sp. UTCIF-39]
MNTSSVLFSVIIPVYDAGNCIERLLRTFVAQNNDRCEVIVVDDGSQDQSLSICNAIANENDFITVLSQHNQGASAARNYGIEHASGKYLVFVDSDDSVADDYVQTVTNICETGGFDLVQCNWVQGTPEDGYAPAYADIADRKVAVEEYCRDLLGQKFNPPWNKIYRRSVIDEHNIRFDSTMTMGEDLEFAIRYVRYVDTVMMSPSFIYRYFFNTDGLCAKASLSYFSDLRKLYDSMKKLIDERAFDESVLRRAQESIIASVFRSIGGSLQQGFSSSDVRGSVSDAGFTDILPSMTKVSLQASLRRELILRNLYRFIQLLFELKNGSHGRV